MGQDAAGTWTLRRQYEEALAAGDTARLAALRRVYGPDESAALLFALIEREADVARLRAAIARHIEREALDDYNAMNLGNYAAPPWAALPAADQATYRDACAHDFWRDA